jgi:carboxyl-terminal processing protease
MDEIWERYSNGELLYADSNKISNGKQYQTNKGKIVYGGGGIMPDIFVPADTSSYPDAVNRLITNGDFNSFVYRYYLQHRSQVDAYTSAADYKQHFNRMDELWNQFVNSVPRDSVDFRILSEKQKENLQRRLEAYLARFRWRNSGYYQVLTDYDPVVKRAMEELKK